jgi:hypothetical protein
VNKKDIDPTNVQIQPIRDEGLDVTAVIDSMRFGVPRPEYYWEKLDSATRGAGIIISLVAEERKSISQFDCKR